MFIGLHPAHLQTRHAGLKSLAISVEPGDKSGSSAAGERVSSVSRPPAASRSASTSSRLVGAATPDAEHSLPLAAGLGAGPASGSLGPSLSSSPCSSGLCAGPSLYSSSAPALGLCLPSQQAPGLAAGPPAGAAPSLHIGSLGSGASGGLASTSGVWALPPDAPVVELCALPPHLVCLELGGVHLDVPEAGEAGRWGSALTAGGGPDTGEVNISACSNVLKHSCPKPVSSEPGRADE